MGFSLKAMFDDLLRILSSDVKDKKKIAELQRQILSAKKYAEECGQLK